MRAARRWAGLAGVLLACGVALSAVVASGRPILAARWSLLWLLTAWAATWLAAVVVLFRVPRRVAVGIIVTGAIALRLAALAGPPVTSDDLYRYSWDGRVQAAGIDPYAQPPDSPTLASLREPWLWPDALGCAALHRAPGCTRINRPDQRTIYPPLAEAWFAGVYRAGRVAARYKAWQVAGLLTDLAVVGLLLVGLGWWGRDRRWAALYALSPAPVLEIVNNGHVDGLGIAFLIAALVALAHRGRWPREVVAGALIGAAALVKIYPGVALAGLVAEPRLVGRHLTALRRWAGVAGAGAVAATLAALAYAPHVARVGTKVLGYLPGYLREEHYRGGGRFLIAAALHVPAHAAGPATAAVALVACWWVLRSSKGAAPAVAALLGTLLLATSPVQPWYAVSLLAVAALAGGARYVPIALAGYPYFFAVILASPHAALIGEIGYGTALVWLVLAEKTGHRVRDRQAGDVEVRADGERVLDGAQV